MKRIIIGLLFGLILSIILQTSALAAGPPDSIFIDSQAEQKAIFNSFPDSDGVPPPEIVIKLKDGTAKQPGRP